MADSDISFHQGTPAPNHPETFGWSGDGDEDDNQSGSNSYGHSDTPYPPPNPITFSKS